MKDDSVLEIENLSVHFDSRFGRVQAINGLNLTVRQGETAGLVGESGCGKSMTARAILGIVPHPGKIGSGAINWRYRTGEVVDLRSFHPKSEELRAMRGKEIGMVFQEPMSCLSPVYTIGSHLFEALRLHNPGMDKNALRKRSIELLDLVGIPNPKQRLENYPFQMSGGMCQRIMIAMAISCEPRLLIADEPTTALDVTIQAQILDLLQRLQDELGMSILIISHDLGVMANVADRINVMYLGSLMEESDTEEFFAGPKHPYSTGLLHSIPPPGSRGKQPLYAIKGRVPEPYTKLTGCPFHPRCSHAMPGRCDVVSPPNTKISENRWTRCHLYVNEEVGVS